MGASGRVRTGLRWTGAEVVALRQGWHVLGQRRLGESLQRSWTAIYMRARQDGLPLGIPQGCVAIKVAARKLGIDRRTLVKELARAEVLVRRAYSSPRRKGIGTTQRSQRSYVEWDTAREVAEAWLQTETVRSAALRRGIQPDMLRGWLAKAGVVQVGTVRGVARRVPSDVIDRVVTEHRPRQQAAQAA